MTPTKHYELAEACLSEAADHSEHDFVMEALAEAQVHALLAQTPYENWPGEYR
jgi:hypothetical protein